MMGRLDGTDAESVTARGTVQNLTRQRPERLGGQMELVRGRIDGKIASHHHRLPTWFREHRAPLREVAAPMLAEFGLAGEDRLTNSPWRQQRLSEADSVRLGTDG